MGKDGQRLVVVTLALMILGAVSPVLAMNYTFTSINFPGATQTLAHGINDTGSIVGFYHSDGTGAHGYLLSSGSFSSINFPGVAPMPTTSMTRAVS